MLCVRVFSGGYSFFWWLCPVVCHFSSLQWLVKSKDLQSGGQNTLQGRETQNKFRKQKTDNSQCGEDVEKLE